MTRTELEHIIRAVAAITNENELIVIGSQAILGQYPDAPKKLLVSDEADIYAPARPDLSDLIRRNTGRAEPVRDDVRVPFRLPERHPSLLIMAVSSSSIMIAPAAQPA